MENRCEALFNGRIVGYTEEGRWVYEKPPRRLPLEVIRFLDTMSSLTYVKYKTTIHTYWKMAGAKSGIKPLKSNVPEFTFQRRPEIWDNPYFTSVFHPKEATLQRRPETIGGSYSDIGFYLKEAMIRKCLNETLTKDQKESIEESIRGNYGSC